MKKEDTEMMLRIFETERAGYAYLYPSDGGERKEDYISTTAENIANYIGSHMFEAEKIVITDMCDRVDVLHMNKSDYTKRYLFSGRIICGECGRTFRRQKIYIGKPYEKIIWTCSGHVEDKESCYMKAIREDVLHRAFTDMWNKLYTNQGTILEPLLKELTELVAARQDSEEIRQLDKEIKDISGQSQILNQVMRKGYMDSALFMESSSKLGWQLTECRRKKTLLTRKLRRTKEIVRTEQLIQLIAEQDGLMEEFDEQLFKMTAEKIVVSKEHDITFCLYNGLKLTERGGGQDAVAHANRL